VNFGRAQNVWTGGPGGKGEKKTLGSKAWDSVSTDTLVRYFLIRANSDVLSLSIPERRPDS